MNEQIVLFLLVQQAGLLPQWVKTLVLSNASRFQLPPYIIPQLTPAQDYMRIAILHNPCLCRRSMRHANSICVLLELVSIASSPVQPTAFVKHQLDIKHDIPL